MTHTITLSKSISLESNIFRQIQKYIPNFELDESEEDLEFP
jgi:hypothetical protein